MGWNDHFDWELDSAIEDLVDNGLLDEDTAGYGIAQKVIKEGYDSLNPNQKRAFDKHVVKRIAERQKELDIQRIIDSNPD